MATESLVACEVSLAPSLVIIWALNASVQISRRLGGGGHFTFTFNAFDSFVTFSS